jgi:hypothetical protein
VFTQPNSLRDGQVRDAVNHALVARDGAAYTPAMKSHCCLR